LNNSSSLAAALGVTKLKAKNNSFMMRVVQAKPFMSVIMLKVVVLSVIMLKVVVLSVIMPRVVVPIFCHKTI
jgi:hypothetical protein